MVLQVLERGKRRAVTIRQGEVSLGSKEQEPMVLLCWLWELWLWECVLPALSCLPSQTLGSSSCELPIFSKASAPGWRLEERGAVAGPRGPAGAAITWGVPRSPKGVAALPTPCLPHCRYSCFPLGYPTLHRGLPTPWDWSLNGDGCKRSWMGSGKWASSRHPGQRWGQAAEERT